MDALSDVLRIVSLKGGVFLDAEFSAPWCIKSQIGPEDCHPFIPEATQILAYHYVVHLAATHFPAGGTLRCDAGTFTRPTVISNPSAPALGVATGSAALSFNDAGAVVDVSLTATAGHRTGTVSTTGRTIAPGASAVTGNFFSQGDGMMLTLGDSGNGKFRIIAAYEVTAGGDAAYRGIATFLCTR